MKNIARRIINTLFPAHRNYTATIAYSGLIYRINIEAPDERRARMFAGDDHHLFHAAAAQQLRDPRRAARAADDLRLAPG